MAIKKVKNVVSDEERKALNLKSSLREMEIRVFEGSISKNPTRIFSIDEKVLFGAHKEVYVRESFRDGLYYVIESMGVVRERNKPSENEKYVREWTDLYKIGVTKDTNFAEKEECNIRFYNSSISALFSTVYNQGVDFDVEYQRDHVWELEDKILLLDSIFKNIDIGKFVMVQRSLSYDGKLYEILDGKQRLTALIEFYEDRFKYKGFYFSELSNRDKNHLEEYGVSYGQLIDPPKSAIYNTFIKLNTSGKPMANADIDKVRELLINLK